MRARLQTYRTDIILCTGLFILAFILRQVAQPVDGFFHDDSWALTAVKHGHWTQLPWVSFNHIGFTALMKMVYNLGLSIHSFAVFPWVLGSLGPVAIYALILHTLKHRPLALLFAGLAGFSLLHITYSGRIKPYVVDVIMLCSMALAVKTFAARFWTRRTALIWLLLSLSVAITTIHGFLIAAISGAVLALRFGTEWKRDWVWRWPAIALQAVAQLAFLIFISGTYFSKKLSEDWDRLNGFPDLSQPSLEIAADLYSRIMTAITIYVPHIPFAPEIILFLTGCGIIYTITSRDMALRLLVALLGVAVFGNLAGYIPMGGVPVAQRASLWMIPLFATLSAAGLLWIISPLSHRLKKPIYSHFLTGLLVIGFIIWGYTGLSERDQRRAKYPVAGMQSATTFLDEHTDGLIMLLPGSVYQIAAQSEVHVTLKNNPRSIIGYTPIFHAGEIYLTGYAAQKPDRMTLEVRKAAEAATGPIYLVEMRRWMSEDLRRSVDTGLGQAGFIMEETHEFSRAVRIYEWVKPY